MKKYILFFVLLYLVCIIHESKGQTGTSKAHFGKNTLIPLNIGDHMPDIPLGNVMNNKTGKIRFAQFKGQLVILDFWNTYCTNCIALFPHMEKLQKLFGSKIQILLVNPWETEQQILARQKIGHFDLPDLPSITYNVQLNKLFPITKGMPHHVWIDGKGIIRITGCELSTNYQKISDFLNGKQIFSMNDNNTSTAFNENIPLFKFTHNNDIQYGSYLTKRRNDYAALTGGRSIDIIDSANKKVRTTIVNKDVLTLYQTATNFHPSVNDNGDNVVYSTNCFNETAREDFMKLLVKDTCNYTFDYLFDLSKVDDRRWGDESYCQSKYCYEQILPLNIAQSQRRELMLNDLNNYFGNKFYTKTTIERPYVDCYVIYRISIDTNIYSKGGGNSSIKDVVIKGGQTRTQYSNCNFRVVLYNIFARASQFSKSLQGKPTIYVMDETGLTQNIDISIPDAKSMDSITTLQNGLKPYNIGIKKERRQISMLIIRESDHPSQN